MRIQASNANGIGNRFRCFLSALRISEDASIFWNSAVEDGVTKEDLLGGIVDPIETLIKTDKAAPYDESAWQVPKFSWFTRACEAGFRSIFALYENFDPRAKTDYVQLRRKYLEPTKEVKDLAVGDFRIGFQLRTKQELKKPPQDRTDKSIYQFLYDVNYPVFLSCDNADLTRHLMNHNKYIFSYTNEHKWDFDREWNYSMAEILTMAGCHTLYVTPGSTYGEMGYLFGDYRPIIRTTNNPVAEVDLLTLKKSKIIV